MLQSIKYFTEVVESGSLIKSAIKHNLVVEELRLCLRNLEHSLGFDLFIVKDCLSFKVTDAGKQFYALIKSGGTQ